MNEHRTLLTFYDRVRIILHHKHYTKSNNMLILRLSISSRKLVTERSFVPNNIGKPTQQSLSMICSILVLVGFRLWIKKINHTSSTKKTLKRTINPSLRNMAHLLAQSHQAIEILYQQLVISSLEPWHSPLKLGYLNGVDHNLSILTRKAINDFSS